MRRSTIYCYIRGQVTLSRYHKTAMCKELLNVCRLLNSSSYCLTPLSVAGTYPVLHGALHVIRAQGVDMRFGAGGSSLGGGHELIGGLSTLINSLCCII